MREGIKKNASRGFTQHHFCESYKSGAGFTLIELMVAISIIGILSTLVMTNSGFNKRQKNLERAAQKLALDIRRAQNLSLAPSTAPICIYGLMTKAGDATHYFIYRDAPPDAITPCPVTHNYQAASSNIVETIAINSGVTLSPSVFDVAFEPPEPITFINNVQNPLAPLTITLSSQDANTRSVVVNRFGQVEIQ